MTEFVNKTKEAITLTITEIEPTLVGELITIESLENLFIEQCLKQMPIHIRPKNTAIKECTEELSIEKSMDDSLEEKKTLDTEMEKNVGTTKCENEPTFSDYTPEHKQINIKNDPILSIRSIKIKPLTIILLRPRFMQIYRQPPQKYIPHLRKMF
uniref:Uncharacterized protein n=1 Tax=viral metagenome TaxID=1070528 RepID=A0A6C0EV01_9ZZZZ